MIHVSWEEVGNFVYTVSVKECIKAALGLNFAAVCYGGYNDCYIKGCEFEPADEEQSDIFRQMKDKIKKMDEAVLNQEADYNMIFVAILKKDLLESEKQYLRKMGCTYTELPRNPYQEGKKCSTEKYYIYGTGLIGDRTAKYLLENEQEIVGYMDSNKNKWNSEHKGRHIVSLDATDELESDAKIMIASTYYDEIFSGLLARGIGKERIVVSPFVVKDIVV